MKHCAPWLTFFAALAIVCLPAQAQKSLIGDATTISVEGAGAIEIAPEFAVISASVTHTENTAADAQNRVDTVTSALLRAIESLPIEDNSLSAGYLRVQPRYRWNAVAEEQQFIGYEATREISFSLTDLDRLGEAMQLLSNEGATSINPPLFDSSQTEAARTQALKAAFQAAKSDAVALAEEAELVLGPAQRVSSGGAPTPVSRPMMRSAQAANFAAEPGGRYEPGQLTVSARISVVFSAQLRQ